MIFNRKKTTTRRRIVSLGIQAIFFFMLYLLIRAWTTAGMASGPAPEFISRDLQGQTVSLADYRGKPVLLHFWASWCRICKLEKGAIDAVSRSWPVLSVAMQSGDDKAVREYMKANGVEWRTIAYEAGELARRFGVKGTPSHFIIDGKGVVRFREMGYTTSWGLRIRLWLADALGD